MQATDTLPEVTSDSPCVGHCTTVLGDEVCRSCLRTFEEVSRWLEMSEDERRAVNQRIFDLRTTGFRPAPE
jgi:hypothetical protein